MDSSKGSYNWTSYQKDVEPIIDRIYLIYGSFSLITAAVQFAIHFSDRKALIINSAFCLLLLGIFLLRKVLPPLFKTVFISLLAGTSLLISHFSNGIAGTGFLTTLALVLTLMIFFRTRVALAVSLLLSLVVLWLTVQVARGNWQYDQGNLVRLNSPGLWVPFFFNVTAITIICIMAIDYFRKKMFSQISTLEGINRNLREKDRKLERYAHFDLLTGLPNRNYFFENLEDREKEGTLSDGTLLLINIRQFRITNLLLGSEQADEVLKFIGQVLSGPLIGEGEFTCRLMGDEFLMWTEQTEETEIAERKEILFREIQDIVIREIGLDVSLTFAAAGYLRDRGDIYVVYSRAVMAMDRAKKSGTGEIVFYRGEMKKGLEDQRKLYDDITFALENNEFEMFYQEQRDTSGRKVVGLEALARWNDRKGHYVSPGVFVPIINKYNLILPFGHMTADLVCRDAARLQEIYGEDITISLNISPILFLSSGFMEFIIGKKESYDIGDNILILELTEDIFVEDYSLLSRIFSRLKAAGFLISLDDFGTGYSSLSYLSNIEFDEVKIDKSLVENIEEDEKQQSIIEAICRLSSVMKFKIVAEGVERLSQLDVLRVTGCHRIQGHLFAKPKPLEDLS